MLTLLFLELEPTIMATTSRKRRMDEGDELANVEFETSEGVEVIPTFDKMGLRDDLLRGIYSYGKQAPLSLVS